MSRGSVQLDVMFFKMNGPTIYVTRHTTGRQRSLWSRNSSLIDVGKWHLQARVLLKPLLRYTSIHIATPYIVM
jgi:hypothetical protein